MGRIWDGGVVGSDPRELAEGYFRIWELASMLNCPACARSFHVKGQECTSETDFYPKLRDLEPPTSGEFRVKGLNGLGV